MRIEHITFGGDSVIRNTDDIYPLTREHFKSLRAGSVTEKIDKTPFTCEITVENNIAIFDLKNDDKLICTNFCCFAKEDKEAVLLYAKSLASKINPTGLLTKPKEDHFIITVIVDPFASPSDFLLAGEIELYIYDAIWIGLQQRSPSMKTPPLSTSTKMQIFEVGKLFPWEKYIGLGDTTVPVFNTKSFDVVVSLINPTSEEIKTFRKGKLEIGLFVEKAIPFLYLDFKQLSFDFALNINKLTPTEIDNWLVADENIIHLFLLDGTTGILKAQRMVSISFLEDIRDILEEQTEQSEIETDQRIQEITQKYTTEQIQDKAIKRIIFK